MQIPVIDVSILSIIFSSAVLGFATMWTLYKAIKLLTQG